MIQPLGNYIFLKFDKKKKSKSGVVLSDVSKEKPAKAVVIAVGEGIMDRHGNMIKTKLKKGDEVIIDPFLPREVKVDGMEYLIMKESEIFAKI